MTFKRSVSVSLLCASLLVGGLGLAWVNPVAAQSTRALPDFTDLVEQVGPSVVNIRTLEKARTQEMQANGPDAEMQEFFRRFFGVPMPMPNTPRPQRPNRAPQEQEQPRGVGSGFILSADGFIMTNAHVVEDAAYIVVQMRDGRSFDARVVGSDPATDIAVLSIPPDRLRAVSLGSSYGLRVGDLVLAVGNPFVESSPDLDELRVGLANDDERGDFDRAQIAPQRGLDPGATGAQTPRE